MVKVTTTTSVNITPDHPTYIAGHAMRTEKFKGVHDEIEADVYKRQIIQPAPHAGLPLIHSPMT